MKTILERIHKTPDGIESISVSLDSNLMGELQYPESKEFLSGLKSLSKLKTIIKHLLISAVSLISMISFIMALWQMHLFAFVWSCLKHCRQSEDEPGCTARYQYGAVKEIEVKWDEATGATTSCMTNLNSALQNDANTNMITTKVNNVGNTMDLRTLKLFELCQAKTRQHGRDY